MRTKDLAPGDLLVWGKRDELQDGTGGVPVICLAVGRYTTTRVPCGIIAVPHERASNGVVIARPVNRWRRSRNEVTGDTDWAVAVVGAASVMPYDVWRIKRDALDEIALMDEAHEAEGRRIAAEAKVLVAHALDLPVDAIGFSTVSSHELDKGRREFGATINVDAAHLGEILARNHPTTWEKVNEVKDRWAEWRRKPLPSACDR